MDKAFWKRNGGKVALGALGVAAVAAIAYEKSKSSAAAPTLPAGPPAPPAAAGPQSVSVAPGHWYVFWVRSSTPWTSAGWTPDALVGAVSAQGFANVEVQPDPTDPYSFGVLASWPSTSTSPTATDSPPEFSFVKSSWTDQGTTALSGSVPYPVTQGHWYTMSLNTHKPLTADAVSAALAGAGFSSLRVRPATDGQSQWGVTGLWAGASGQFGDAPPVWWVNVGPTDLGTNPPATA